MNVNVQEIKGRIFNLNDPIDKAYSLFEVVNTSYPGYGKPKIPLESLVNNTIDLDPRITKLIDDNFWQLF